MSTQDPTISKRSQDLRQRHKASGDKSYLLWLSPATQARLARLKRQGETLAQLVDRALEALEGVAQGRPCPEIVEGQAQSVAKQRETVANSVAERTQEDRQRLDVWVPDDLVDSLRDFLLGGVANSVANPVANQRGSVAKSVAKQRLVAQAKELHKQGVSFRDIARRWNAEGIPTHTGKGQWHGASVARLVSNG